MRTALTVLDALEDAAATAAAQASIPQAKTKNDSNGRKFPLMGTNSTASRARLQVFFPLLSDGCSGFIERG
ncbi:MAG TPA: hypothetical protein VHD89_06400 [Rhodanobacteraceae bacterium]|jgi:hypothetical protein|nr:hypothetical protein [Rhodanobacteraceae bacterium]